MKNGNGRSLKKEGERFAKTITSVRRYLWLVFLCLALPLDAAEYNIDPVNGDDQASGFELAPWATFNRAWQTLQPGDHLVLADGLYVEALDIGLSGNVGNPIIIRAKNDGKVIISTQAEPAINILNKSHLVLEGISAETTGNTATIVISGHDGPDWSDRSAGITLRRMGARGGDIDTNGSVMAVARAIDVLLEDVWVYGNGRAVLQVHGSENVTVRRAVVRWDGWRGLDYNPRNTRSGIVVSNTKNSIFENIFVFDGGSPGFGEAPETTGPLAAFRVTGSKGYNHSPVEGASNNLFRGIVIVDNASRGLQVEGGVPLLDNQFNHIVAWGNQGLGVNIARKTSGTSLSHLTVLNNSNGIRVARYWDKVYNTKLFNSIVQNNTVVPEGRSSIGIRGDKVEMHHDFNFVDGHKIDYHKLVPGSNAITEDPELSYLFRLEANSPVVGLAADRTNPGAEIIYRSVDGLETNISLWPYPNEARIRTEMCQVDSLMIVGRTGAAKPNWCTSDKTLSRHFWTLLGGACPSGFCDIAEAPKPPVDREDLPPLEEPPLRDDPTGPEYVGDYYISPTSGSDNNNGSNDSPWQTLGRAWSSLVPGDTLILKDGEYNEALVPTVSGEPGNPITIIAQHDGEAIFITSDEPAIRIANQNYITVEGIVARTLGETNTVVIAGHDGPDWTDKTTGIIFRRVSAEGSSLHKNSGAFLVGRASQVLLEDVWSFGHARNTMIIYGSEHVTVRRAVIRWDGWWGDQYKPDDPRVSLSVYNTRDSLFENVIILDGGEQGVDTHGERVALAVAGNNNGETAPFNDSSNNRFVGVILLNNIGAGVNVESGGGTLVNNHFEHLVSWNNSRTGFNVNQDADGTSLTHGTIGMNNTGVRFNNYGRVVNNALFSNLVLSNRKAELVGDESFGINGGGGDLTNNDYNNVVDHQTNYRKYSMTPGLNSFSLAPDLDFFLVVPNNSVNKGAAHDAGDIGATIIYRSVDGNTSTDKLWPYPYEARIKAEMCDPLALNVLGRNGENSAAWCSTVESLSEYIWQYLGHSCPAEYCPTVP